MSQLGGTKERCSQGLKVKAGMFHALETVLWRSRLSLAGPYISGVTWCSTGFKGPDIQTGRKAQTGQLGA